MRAKENLQQQIDELTAQLQNLQAQLDDLPEDQQQPTHHTANRSASETQRRYQYDQDGQSIFVQDIVLFRPSGTRSGSTLRVRGVITRFTAQRVYIRRETDNRITPQEILRDPAHVKLIKKFN